MKDMAKNSNNHLAVRIGCLRKYYEHHYKKPKDDSVEYNILSMPLIIYQVTILHIYLCK